ncbi:YitT family protein [Acholeplasma equirhinis]|uniref:YitT family protein n=1 Tax=Acholeplasma equirhinis TaxID=555393 RepID=UPI00197AFEB7|nr:YitT family protein [Acholeplasma equirhinis]MBN3490910.1 YitT family protein [Acholeplasma equirhinis]
MNKLMTFFKSEFFAKKVKPELKRTTAVVVFTIIYGFGVTWFLEASVVPMYTGGIPGIAQLLRDLIKYTFGVDMSGWEGLFLGGFIIAANIPILILGWFGVSKKFVIYSLISVLIQATMLGYIPYVDLGLSSPAQALTATILGGILVGIGAGGALRYGTSTGGLDIIAQYVALKKGQSVGFISMIMNIAIAVFGGLITSGKIFDENNMPIVAGVVISYTILRLIVSTVMIDRLHTGYQFVKVDIVTNNANEIVTDILTKIYRGVTMINVQGGYTKTDKTMIVVVISSYELTSMIQMINQVDKKAFIVCSPVKAVYGNFKKKTIA